MLMGEKPPPWEPCTTMAPISSGLIWYRAAKESASGATIATAAGLTAPIAVSAPLIANITHGISATRPPTSRIDACTSQSVVPLARARANRYVTPTSTTNRSPGNPAKMWSALKSATSSPTPKAAAKDRAPILIDRVVAMTKTTTSTSIEINSSDIERSRHGDPVGGPGTVGPSGLLADSR